MKEMMNRTKNADDEICELWFEDTEMWWWNRSEALYRLLKRYTGTEARRVVQGVIDDNGWEAWRRLSSTSQPRSPERHRCLRSTRTW